MCTNNNLDSVTYWICKEHVQHGHQEEDIVATILFLVVGGYLFSVDHVKVTRTTAVYRPKTKTLGAITIAASLLGAGLSTMIEVLHIFPYFRSQLV